MTIYRQSMAEAYQKVLLGEDNMALMKKAAGGAMQTIKMKDGKLKMDSFTASAIMAVHKAVNDKNKKSIEQMINTGTKAQIMKLQSLAMKQIKSGDELEHDGEELDEGIRASRPRAGGGREGKAIEQNLAVHNKLMQDLIKQGMSKEKASKVAFDDMEKMKPKEFKKVLASIKEEVELDEGYLELTFKDKQTAEKAYNYINNKIWAGGNPPYDDITQEGNEIQIDTDGNLNRRNQMLKDLKALPSNMKFKVTSNEEVELGEGKFQVKSAASKKGKITVTDFDSLEDAEKHLAGMEKKGHKGIISKNGKPVFRGTSAEIKKQMKAYKKKHDKIGIGEDMTVTGSTDGGISQRDLDYVQKELRKLGIKDAVVDQNEMDSKKMDIKTKMSNDKVKKAFDKSKMTVTYEHKGSEPHKHPHDEDELDEGGMKRIATGGGLKTFTKKPPEKKGGVEKKKEGVDPADIDHDATDDDVKAADKNIIMQMRKVISLRGNFKVEFGDKKKQKIDPKIALAVQDKYDSFKKPADKEKFQAKVSKSYKDMLSAIKEGFTFNEGTWHTPKTPQEKAGLKKLLKKPVLLGKDGDDAIDAISDYIGDDQLYDDLHDASKKDGPKADARPLIRAAMQQLGIKEEKETILDRIDKKIKERKNG